jgi:hypothetical protein
MKMYGGSGDIALPFLTLALDGGEWSASHPGSCIPSGRAQSGHCGEEKNPLPLLGIEPWPSSL